MFKDLGKATELDLQGHQVSYQGNLVLLAKEERESCSPECHFGGHGELNYGSAPCRS